jgi:hypothetical protein
VQQPPGNYRIRVEGQLAADWSDRLGGLSITTTDEDGGLITTLSGRLIDQAALLEVVIALDDLQLPILLAERMEDA